MSLNLAKKGCSVLPERSEGGNKDPEGVNVIEMIESRHISRQNVLL